MFSYTISSCTQKWLSCLLLLTLIGCGKSDSQTIPNPETATENKPKPTENGTPASTQVDMSSVDRSSPEATFDSFKDAVAAGEWKEGSLCLSEDSQSALCGGLIFLSAFMTAFEPERKETLEELLAKYKVDQTAGPPPMLEPSDSQGPAAMMQMMGKVVKDKPGFISEMIQWLEESDGESNFDQVSEGKLKDLKIEADSASALVVTSEDEKPIEFVKQDSVWLISLTDEMFDLGGGSNDTTEMDFSMDGEFGEYDDFDFDIVDPAPLPALKAISETEFDKSWKVSVQVENQPAEEIIKKMAAECGFELFKPEQFSEELAKPVTLDLKGVSRLQVLEQACSQAGLYPRYRLKRLGFKTGTRPFPISFSGPCALIVESVDEYVPYAAGDLRLKVVMAGTPTAAVASLEDLTSVSTRGEETSYFAINEINGTGGTNLQIPVTEGTVKLYMPKLASQHAVFSPGVSLLGLTRTVEQIKTVSCELRYSIPTEVTSLKFDQLEKGATAAEGEIKLTLKQVQLADNPDGNTTLSINYEGARTENLKFHVFDKNDQLMDANGGGGFFDGNQGNYSMFLSGIPARIEVQVIKNRVARTEEFVVKNIPLAKAAEMPEQMAELTYDGEAPIKLSFKSIQEQNDRREILYEVTNISNKDISTFSMNVDYLDDAKEKLDDFPNSQGGQRNMLPAGETKKYTIPSFFMPEETKSAVLTPTRVDFADNTSWDAE